MAESNNYKSFIEDDGVLSVRLQPKYTAWYDFLWFSRGTNSENGGWNDKTHWWEGGVKKLLADTMLPCLKLWTENSLYAEHFHPAPRERKFMFNRTLSAERAALFGELDRKSIEVAREDELNVGLYKEHWRLEPLSNVNFLTYELPLTAHREAQLKVDLFGVSKTDGPAIKIIELKDADSDDSPLFALVETICYGLQTLRCKDYMLKEEPRLEQKHLEIIDLMIVAPAAYWKKWKEGLRQNEVKGEIQEFLDVLKGAFQRILQPVEEIVKESFNSTTLKVALIELREMQSNRSPALCRSGAHEAKPLL